MWRAIIAGIVYQHDSVEHLVRELHRNLGLLQFCGFHPLPRQSAPVYELHCNPETSKSESHTIWKPCLDSVLHQWNFKRFFKRLISPEEKYGMISNMIWQLREQLMDEIADFGVHLGYGGKALNIYSSGRMIKSKGKTSDPDADWGRHEYRGVDKNTGKPWSKIKFWFGYLGQA